MFQSLWSGLVWDKNEKAPTPFDGEFSWLLLGLGTLLRIGLRSPYLLKKRQLRLLSDSSDAID
ncbi:hypothetical protein [Paenibacillus odorifer]|uniref:hypothetical protein n=1 Tax=Paenibacillus TaxID=44249 RepID=UPI001131E41E|nr:hypothetical protein [Paenibacillus odorifer]